MSEYSTSENEAYTKAGEANNSSHTGKKEKSPKRGVGVFSVILIVLFINAIWVAATVFYFVPTYQDAVYVREQQIEEYEKELKALQKNQDSTISEYLKRIDDLEEELNEQKSQYEDALALLEKYSNNSPKTSTSGTSGGSGSSKPSSSGGGAQ